MNRIVFVFALVLSVIVQVQAQSENPPSIYDNLLKDKSLLTLVNLVNISKLNDDLQEMQNITFFAPTNKAFLTTLKDLGFNADVGEDEVLRILTEYRKLSLAKLINVRDLLNYHIVPQRNLSTADIMNGQPIVSNLANKTFAYDTETKEIVDANNETANAKFGIKINLDIPASNGQFHYIDRLLLPSQFNLNRAEQLLSGSNASAELPSNATDNATNPCFPASAIVHIADGSTITMKQLTAGVSVRVSHTERFSPVFMFSHKQHHGFHHFVQLTTASGHQITLSPSHYIYANNKLAAARAVRVGDTLRTLNGFSPVSAVRTVRELGLFAPHAVHSGDIVVNGIVASSYTTAVHPRVAQFLLAPVRALVRMRVAKEPLGSLFYNGADRFANLLPSGPDML